MYLCVILGVSILLLDFGTVPSDSGILELFRPTVWYFGTVPSDSVVFWNCSVRQCGILELFRPTVLYFGTVPSDSVVFWNCSV
jgi:hypothetical protein